MLVISNERPAYRILAQHGFYVDDHLYEEGQEILFDGEPNEEMEPLNEIARQKLIAYVEKLDRFAKEVAEKTGRPYTPRPRNLDGAVELATAVHLQNRSIMGKKDSSNTASLIEDQDVPETGSINPKRGRGRPVGSVKASRNGPLTNAA